VAVVLLATFCLFSIAAPSFFSIHNVLDILHVVSPMIIVASGMALVVISGKARHFGRVDRLCRIGDLHAEHAELQPFVEVAAAVSLAVGSVLGAINGIRCGRPWINSLIATLGTMIAFRGLGLSMTDGGMIGLPEAVKPLGNAAIGPLYVDTLIALAILLGVDFVHRQTSSVGR